MKALKEQKFYIYTLLLTFFFVLTAQTFWSTIHGDGAVYAYLIKEISKSGLFLSELPNWNLTEKFAEHPYLFFIFGSWFTKLFGYSDLAVKLPNYFISAVTLWFLFAIAKKRHPEKQKATSIVIIASYALLLNATFVQQVSQPTLDPLAQLLAFVSFYFILYKKSFFTAGLILGLAFLTKGLELLPNFGAISLIIGFMYYKEPKQLLKKMILFVFAVSFMVFLWLAYDQIFLSGEWLKIYWHRQFESRFLLHTNMQSIFGFGFLKTFISLYFVEIIIFIYAFFHFFRSKNILVHLKTDLFGLYFVIYTIINLTAFLIIKKDSSQHMIGTILTGAILLAEIIYSFASNLKKNVIKSAATGLLLFSFFYWSWFILHRDKNPDIWTEIKLAAKQIKEYDNNLPVVVAKVDGQYYGLFNTSLWYLNSNKVYNFIEAQNLLKGQEVIKIELTSDSVIRHYRDVVR